MLITFSEVKKSVLLYALYLGSISTTYLDGERSKLTVLANRFLHTKVCVEKSVCKGYVRFVSHDFITHIYVPYIDMTVLNE